MKIELEVNETDIAMIWHNQWGYEEGKPFKQCVLDLIEDAASRYKKQFPNEVELALIRFREANRTR